MKRLFTILVFVLSVSIVTFSQDFAKKGMWELGGSVGFTSSTYVSADINDPNGATTTFSISPEAGYFITDNFELSLLPFSFISSSYHTYSSSQFNFLLAPTWNFEMHSNIYPYIQALIGYGTESFKNDVPYGYDYTVSGADYGFQAGIKLQVAKSSILNFGLSYLMTNRKQSGETGRFGDNILQVMAGFSVFVR
jgi:hypothetical protein